MSHVWGQCREILLFFYPKTNLLKLRNNGQLKQRFEQSVFDRYRPHVRKYLLRNLNLEYAFY